MSDSQQPEYPTYPPAYTPPPPTFPPAGPVPVSVPVPVPPMPDSPPPPTGSGSSRRTIAGVALVAAVVGAGVGAGTVALVNNDNNSPSSANLQVSNQAAPAVKVDGSVSAAAEKIRPSVVTIDVSTQQEEDTGSGVIIRSDGYILTNNHVISSASKAGTIAVTLADGRRTTGKIVGQDSSDDLAVIKVNLTGLTAATFARSSSLVVGQTVVAVGAPLGLSDTVTSGIVSSTARPVQTGDTTNNQAVFNAVQTDAAINPGNSGGPLVDLNGNVVGINAAIATDQSQGGLQVPGNQSGNIGIGFAIPSDEASRIAAELITTGKATHAVMGVTVRDATTGSSSTSSVGAVVQSVKSGGPADHAGIKVGDVITQVDTQRIDTADALVAAIRSHAPGQTATIIYQRGGKSHTVQVKLGGSSN